MDEEIQKLLCQATISIEEAGRVLGIGRNGVHDVVKRGEIESISLGKRRRVLTAPLRRKLGLEVMPA